MKQICPLWSSVPSAVKLPSVQLLDVSTLYDQKAGDLTTAELGGGDSFHSSGSVKQTQGRPHEPPLGVNGTSGHSGRNEEEESFSLQMGRDQLHRWFLMVNTGVLIN